MDPNEAILAARGRPIPSIFGSAINSKTPDCSRILFQNVRGIPKKGSDPQNAAWMARMKAYDIDVSLLAEVNINWSNTNHVDALRFRPRRFWNASRCINSYNIHEKDASSTHLQGGTSCIIVGDMTHRSSACGSDPTGLGRWSWVVIRGPQNSNIVFVSAYCPINGSNLPGSVTAQHRRYFSDRNDDRPPATAFFEDLSLAVTAWKEKGFHIVIGIDANIDTNEQAFKRWTQSISLIDVLDTKYGKGPPSRLPGTAIIDAILVSNNFPVARAGVIRHGDLLESDHSGLWLDFNTTTILGSIQLEPSQRPRRLTASNPNAVTKYLNSYRDFIKRNDLVAKVEKLREIAYREGLTANVRQQIESIDNLRVSGMLLAEAGCRKLRMGKIPHSPALSQAHSNHRYAKLRAKLADGKNISASTLRRAKKKCSFGIPSRATKRELDELLKKTKRCIRQAKTRIWDDEIRSINAIASKMSSLDGRSVHSHAQQIRNTRTTKQRFGVIKQVLQPQRHVLMTLGRPNPDGTVEDCFDKDSVEQLALAEGERRFRQTEHSAFMNEPLSSMLGYRADGPASQQVLDGTFQCPSEVDEYTRELLQGLRRPTHVQLLPAIISEKEWKNLWQKSRENTGCGDSGLHFAIFKVNCTDADALRIDLAMANLCYSLGYALARWSRSINVFLPKKSTSTLPEKQRIIHLWEADSNAIFKILARQATRAADSYHLLAPEQYGSRPEHSAAALSLAQRLTFDLARQRRQTIAVCCNDASQCYDRIVHTPAALALQRVGMRPEPVECMFSMLQSLNHHVKTGHGISKKFFSATAHISTSVSNKPIQGIGQGNGAGPTTWAVISSVILDKMHKKGVGLQLVAPISEEFTLLTSTAFVDDANTIEGARSSADTYIDVTGRLQAAVNLWSNGIKATGGDINAEKSFWTLVNYDTSARSALKCRSIKQTPADVFMDDNGTIKKLHRCEPNEAIMSLGVLLAADGNEKDQVNHLLKKTQEWCAKIKQRKLPKEVVHTALNTTISRTLAYPMAVTCLDEATCERITSELRQTVLPLLGFNRNSPKIVVHADVASGGLGFPNLWSEQISQRNAMLVEHGSSNTVTGKLIRCTLETLKLELGNGLSLHECQAERWSGLATHCWIRQTWMDNESVGLCTHDPTPNIQLLSVNDQFLNNVALDMNRSMEDRKAINHVRLYFNVSSVAEICTPDGKKVQDRFLRQPLKDNSPLSSRWPAQRVPTRKEWRAWRSLLKDIAMGRSSVTLPLGSWFADICHRFHRFDLINESNSIIYRRATNNWQQWNRRTGWRLNQQKNQQPTFQNTGITVASPTGTLRPTTCTDKWAHARAEDTRPIKPQEPEPRSFESFLSSIPPHQSWACSYILSFSNAQALSTAISSGDLRAVSDGSYFKGRSSSAWILTSSPGFTLYGGQRPELEGRNLVPGPQLCQDSCRAELGGVAGIVYCVDALVRFFKLHTGTVEIGLDGLSAIEIVDNLNSHRCTIGSHHDLANNIIQCMKKSKCNFKFRHIRGHQDDHNIVLDDWEILNVRMDKAAKEFRVINLPNPPASLPPGSHNFSVSIGRSTIVRNLRKEITRQTNTERMRRYWSAKFDMDDNTASAIDWDARAMAGRQVHPSLRRYVVQHCTGFSSAGDRLRKRGSPGTFCPFCKAVETEEHVLTCQQILPRNERKEKVGWLRQRLKELKTPRRLVHLVLTAALPSDEIDSTTTRQTSRRVLMGFIPLFWRNQFEMEQFNNKLSPLKWAADLVRALWKTAKSLWQFRVEAHLQSDQKKHNEREDSEINDRIRQIWGKRRGLLISSERFLFRGQLDALLGRRPKEKKDWIRTAETVHKRAARRNFDETRGMRAAMARWLGQGDAQG